MSGMRLESLLGLVGSLDDAEGEDTPRERFRRYLVAEVSEIGLLRDYVETCLRTSGPQWNRALQDLVNRIGELLGFEVEYGRYAGRQGVVGHDGHWRSPSGDIIVEVKTTDAYAITTATVLNYVNELISHGRLESGKRHIGLYVVGRPDADLLQLENAITAENRMQALRVASVDSLLTLAELVQQYDFDHESVVSVLFPSGPRVDPTVDLMAGLVGQEARKKLDQPAGAPLDQDDETHGPAGGSEGRHYLAPVRWKGLKSPMDAIGRLLAAKKYAFAERTPCRKDLKAGDYICFFASGMGVFAHARVTSSPVLNPLPSLTNDAESYPWTFDLDDVVTYVDDPVVLNAEVRGRLDAFKDAIPSRNWGWFVTATSRLTENDFRVLTRK